MTPGRSGKPSGANRFCFWAYNKTVVAYLMFTGHAARFLNKTEQVMKRIPFVKYTSCGNNFVIVDALQAPLLSEAQMSDFAFQATSTSFGVGCDNLLVLQPCNRETLNRIHQQRPYWRWAPDADKADFLFRMFEPDGEEALCCGNGLMCIASHLLNQHGIQNARIMTEIPLNEPKIIEIGSGGDSLGGWVNLGHPRKTPVTLLTPGFTEAVDPQIDFVADLSIAFRGGDLRSFTEATELSIQAHLVFTGEPHLVIFPDRDFSIPELADYIFAQGVVAAGQDRRENFGTWLVDHIGNQINRRFRHLFPAGISVNYARQLNSAEIENRCFERGINRETLACGTGSLAVAYIFSYLQQSTQAQIDILPHRCRWHDDQARIRIQRSDSGWHLSSSPELLFEGVYPVRFQASEADTPAETAVSGVKTMMEVAEQ